MALGEVVTNLPPSTPSWKGLGNRTRSFSSATTPVDAENWVAHIKKIFEVLGCVDEFKARLASYKLEGDALNWWKAFKQAKEGETYVATLSWKDFRDIFLLQYFPRLASFMGKKAGTLRFSVRGQVRITRGTVIGTVFDRQLRIAIRGVMIRRVMTVSVMTSRVATVIRSHDITEVSSTTVLLGLQVRKDIQIMPPLLHVTYVGNFIRARHVIGLLELVSLVVQLGIWPGIALRMVETVIGEVGTTINLLLRGEYFLRLRIRQLILQGAYGCILERDVTKVVEDVGEDEDFKRGS
ncbi:zinc finger, CCHC-type, retrotransposon gag domain protein [Tanacetum coccineum]